MLIDNPVWATDAKLEWEAGGTLANGLSISVGADQDAITIRLVHSVQ